MATATALLDALRGTIEKKGFTEAGTAQETLVLGLSGSQRTLFTASLIASAEDSGDFKGPFVIVTTTAHNAAMWHRDLTTLLPPSKVMLFPAVETLPHEEVLSETALIKNRMRALEALKFDPTAVIVVPIQAASQKLVPPRIFDSKRFNIAAGDVVDLDQLAHTLVDMGYRRVDRVEGTGEYSVRGGIIDLFPPAYDHPLRLDFFDDVVDSIRIFEIDSQRSESTVNSVSVGPATESLLPGGRLEDVAKKIEQVAAEQARRLHEQQLHEEADALVARVANHVEKIRLGVTFEGIGQYIPFFYSEPATILDYADRATVIYDDPVRLEEQFRGTVKDTIETQSFLLEKGRILPEQIRLLAEWNEVFPAGGKRLYLSALDRRVPGMRPGRVIELTAKTPESFHGRFERLTETIKARRKQKFKVCLLVSTPERGARIVEAFRDDGLDAIQVPHLNGELEAGHVVVTTGRLENGVEFPSGRLLVLTDTEIFGRIKKRRRTTKRTGDSKPISHFGDLKDGDYVVHTNHGIGRYIGVETLEISGAYKDYLVVKYAGEDKLYVPTDQVDLLQRYYGVESGQPKLSRLGGNEWTRVKKRVKASVREMAEDLLQLYAARETVEGHAFAMDTIWQTEFEDAFPFEETHDQLQAIQEIKSDMERPRPMDRLLCGDVGYGKTEVAVRASFKAVMDGKQVAVLVPTTILAQQHGRTFKERFSSYPVKVRVLSRFQSSAEQSEIIQGIKNGSVDIVIGTHRLLSKEVSFKDLGLVVVDEEQRFGVAQKERLKEMRKNVDVLTLSATPIPRTLHMSMVGVRDMSVIETPPEDRLPVRTYVVEYDDELIREALMREIGRGGQVYFVYNQVKNIDVFASSLKKLAPEARIAIAHGQMDEDRLERVMLDFLNGEYDVLLCSTIIETGMDIANVNTLIVYDADRLGLAQLYQLRGRVGRSHRVAYSYFTYRRDKVLAEDAEKRLQAIKDFTELGSGFKIAMRDLEIRGAGNLLGPEQHGYIASVGFELYCRLLEESIKELKGETMVKLPDPVIDLDIDAYISSEYISDSRQKVEVYKKVVGVSGLEDAKDLEDEIRDRFGELPAAVLHLLAVSRIKIYGRTAGIGSISSEKDEVNIKMLSGVSLPREASELTRKYRGRAIAMHRTSTVIIKGRGLEKTDLLALVEMVVRDIADML